MLYDIYTTIDVPKPVLVRHGVDEETAAAILGVDPAELAWAIEEAGRCDTEAAIAVPMDDPAP